MTEQTGKTMIKREKVDQKTIGKIKFGFYSSEEIMKMSVCEITNADREGPGSVYDCRMGTTKPGIGCETCGLGATECQGHFGHIVFPMPIVHPLVVKRVECILNCVCLSCYRLLLTEDMMINKNLTKFRGRHRFIKAVAVLKKVEICCHCSQDHPQVKVSQIDQTFGKLYENKDDIVGDEEDDQDNDDSVKKDKNKFIVPMKVSEIKQVFNNIPNSDIALLGLKPESMHPRNLILSVLPVLPSCDRPFVKINGTTWDDDLTNKYIEIVRQCIILSDTKKLQSQKVIQKAFSNLNFHVSTMMNNKNKKATHSSSGKPINGIKDRISRKSGHIRGHLTGRRCDFTARTVAGPDPDLKFGEVAIPREIAKILTIPVPVTKFNIDELQRDVNENRVNSVFTSSTSSSPINIERYRHGTYLIHGDVIIRNGKRIVVENNKMRIQSGDQVERNGSLLKQVFPEGRTYKLNPGYIAERHLRDGDYVLMGRQPTLHRGSLQGMQVVVKDHRTIRVNLGITKPLNLDFDGDELNIHLSQSLKAQSELKHLAAAKHNIISSQTSKPNVAIVQDALVSSYRMTRGFKKVKKGIFFDIACIIPKSPDVSPDEYLMMSPSDVLSKMNTIRRVLKLKGKRINAFTGKGLFSLFLPNDLIYESKNGVDPNEPIVKIYRGVLYEGTLDKTILGSSHNSLIQIMQKEYGPDMCSHFIDCVHFVGNAWLKYTGFTIGLGDCLISSQEKRDDIQDAIKKSYLEAKGIKTTTTHTGIREMRVTAALNKAKDIGLKIAKDSLKSNNNFLSTTISGSKGDPFNIAQITGLLGQQNIKGQRVPLSMNNGRRSLPHYPFEIVDDEMEYESRGFISRSFIDGLNPRQLFFHAMSGREGVTDTALGTAVSGYMQRQLSKLMEDTKVCYDGSVRDGTGRIYQLAYGDDGFDPIHMVKVGKDLECCDVSRLVDKLNINAVKKKKSAKNA